MPKRTNITLESYEMANMGGDILALGLHCAIGLLLVILIETGICLVICRKKNSTIKVH